MIAALRICVWHDCLHDYGLCSMFSDYQIVVNQLNKISLRTNFNQESSDGSSDDIVQVDDVTDDFNQHGSSEDIVQVVDMTDDFLLSGFICAIASDTTPIDAFWLIKINGQLEATENVFDNYGPTVMPGQSYLLGQYLENIYSNNKGHMYKLMEKTAIFFKENVVYPFVLLSLTKYGLFISMNDFTEILNSVEHNGLSSI